VSSLIVHTCAKVNLSLRVLSRRPDGYHNVETVLHTVGIWDTVQLTDLGPEAGISLRVEGGEAPEDEGNLCWRAAQLLAEHARVGRGVAILLQKAIPAGAGLGGGSSDGAATLVGLTRLWGLTLEREEMLNLAARLGSDVPFFLLGGCCLALERGERLEPLPSVALPLVVVVPEWRAPTAKAYAALRRGASLGRRKTLTGATRRAVVAVRSGDPVEIAGALHNDFEAAELFGVGEALEAKAALMEAGCLGALLSGSGSAVFGIAPDGATAGSIAAHLRERWDWVSIAPTVPAEESMIYSDQGVEARES
jgi:4-diphosphocytidyl-2-C-methyl-D-erythritol kinase